MNENTPKRVPPGQCRFPGGLTGVRNLTPVGGYYWIWSYKIPATGGFFSTNHFDSNSPAFSLILDKLLLDVFFFFNIIEYFEKKNNFLCHCLSDHRPGRERHEKISNHEHIKQCWSTIHSCEVQYLSTYSSGSQLMICRFVSSGPWSVAAPEIFS